MKLLCLLFGHKEWKPSQLQGLPFIAPTNAMDGDQWKVCLCGRCKLVYWEML